MEFISERVSLEHRPDGVSVVITARLPETVIAHPFCCIRE